MRKDYDGTSEAARTFYQRIQAKLFFAVTSHTPSEIVAARADAAAPGMGLQTRPKEDIRQQDALVAKNYLAPAEITELNRLTGILLDIFEDQLDVGRLTTMGDATRILDEQLASLGRGVLRGGGQVSHKDAENAARAHYKQFDKARRLARREQADEELRALKATEGALPKRRKPKV